MRLFNILFVSFFVFLGIFYFTSNSNILNAGGPPPVPTDDVNFYNNLGTSLDAYVNSVVTQPDGKILVGGSFNELNGIFAKHFVRLNSEGTYDTDFNTNLGVGFNGDIYSIAVQPDGKILVAGFFYNLNENERRHIVRLNSDGTEDTSFNTNLGQGFNNGIFSVSLQPDGKILVGGAFTEFNSNLFINGFARLNADGTEDTSFNTNLGTGFAGPNENYPNSVRSIVVQPDGKIILGGDFYSFNGNPKNYFVRLNSDGTEDTDFNTNLGSGFDGSILSVVLQPDGKILVGGGFAGFNNNIRKSVVRLNSDGTEDTDFYTNLGSGFSNIYSIAVQPDGKILVGGEFTSFNANPRNYIVRLNSDGTEDTDFYINSIKNGFGGSVNTINAAEDGSILVGGNFTSFNDFERKYLVRFSAPALLKLASVYPVDDSSNVSLDSDINIVFNQNILPNVGNIKITNKSNNKIVAEIDVVVGKSTNNIWTMNINSNAIVIHSNSIILENGTAYLVEVDDEAFKTIHGIKSKATTFTFNTTNFISSNGAEDASFYGSLGTSFNNGTIYSMAYQPDSKILVGGDFQTFNDITRNYLVRLNSDSTEDLDFYANLGNGFDAGVNSIVVDPDGNILVGGDFSGFNNNSRNRFVRLNSDGTEDTEFYTNLGVGFNGTVRSIALQPDGKILVGGDFDYFNNERYHLIRLNSDGTEDTDFYTNLGVGFNNGGVRSVALQPDGKILVGGDFDSFNNNTRNRLVRLNSDGTEDTDFNTNLGVGFNGGVRSVALQPDGKILVGGGFNSFNDIEGNILVRLNSDGTEDTDFYASLDGFGGEINSIVVQPYGQILVGGGFYANTRRNFVRLNSDGSGDDDFYKSLGNALTDSEESFRSFNDKVTKIIILPEGNIIVGGSFTSLSETPRVALVKLYFDDTLPVLTEVNPILPTPDTTPDYTFSSSKNVNILATSGGCSIPIEYYNSRILAGENKTITFDELTAPGIYSDCSIIVEDAFQNQTYLNITPFEIVVHSGAGNGRSNIATPSASNPISNLPVSIPVDSSNSTLSFTPINNNNQNTNNNINTGNTCATLPNIPNILKLNTVHPTVKILQNILNCKGYNLTTTGYGSLNHETSTFSILTKKAVLLFQKANNIVIDGIVGPETRGVLNK